MQRLAPTTHSQVWPTALGHFVGAYVCGGVTYFVETQAYDPMRPWTG
jgi:hypothetical protein